MAQTDMGEEGIEPRLALGDALGSVRCLTRADDSGSNGFVEVCGSYAAFGASLDGGAGSLTSYAFAGERFDPFPGAQCHRARWLDPSRGQWLSADAFVDFPEGFALAYAYVGNGPTMKTDPTGLFSLTELVIAAAWQTIVHGIALPMVVEPLARATLTSLGVNPAQLFFPLFEKVASAFGIYDFIEEVLEVFQVDLGSLDTEMLLEQFVKVAKFMSVCILATDGAFAVLSLARFLLARNLKNAWEAISSIFSFYQSWSDFTQEGEASLNPNAHYLMKKKYAGTGIEIHHILSFCNREFTEAFRGLFDTEADLKKFSKYLERADWNLVAVPGHKGRHTKAYHQFVLEKSRKAISKEQSSLGKSLTRRQRRLVIKRTVMELGNRIMRQDGEVYEYLMKLKR